MSSAGSAAAGAPAGHTVQVSMACGAGTGAVLATGVELRRSATASGVRQLSGDERKAAIRAHAERLVAAGVTLVGERNDTISWWIVLTDPERNELCLQ